LEKPWCSTKVNESTREHVKGGGFYGDCDDTPQCPNVGGYDRQPFNKVVTNGKGVTSCKCQSHSTCTWSKAVVNLVVALPKNHPDYRFKVQLFQSQICDKEKQYVWCCRNGEHATKSELELLLGK